ncbi:hypothetical protein [Leptospira andrefontaineae]|uniref:hypothetical protein n=1 Tax=Leptospira andrefontaineae TaxID=2484976 RepID=UPI00142E2E03|nr:hypothetical protein [Leptospira andrefontaineae]
MNASELRAQQRKVATFNDRNMDPPDSYSDYEEKVREAREERRLERMEDDSIGSSFLE